MNGSKWLFLKRGKWGLISPTECRHRQEEEECKEDERSVPINGVWHEMDVSMTTFIYNQGRTRKRNKLSFILTNLRLLDRKYEVEIQWGRDDSLLPLISAQFQSWTTAGIESMSCVFIIPSYISYLITLNRLFAFEYQKTHNDRFPLEFITVFLPCNMNIQW